MATIKIPPEIAQGYAVKRGPGTITISAKTFAMFRNLERYCRNCGYYGENGDLDDKWWDGHLSDEFLEEDEGDNDE